VEKDPKIDEIVEVLPGANCGGCGYAGCTALAEAVVTGKAPVNGCPVGGSEVAKKVAAIMGVESGDDVRSYAYVKCTGCPSASRTKYDYYGGKDCLEAMITFAGDKTCAYGCLGYGTGVKACKFGAIKIENGLAVIDPEKCTACGACIKVCPKNVIDMRKDTKSVAVLCSSKDKGKAVKAVCDVGCIACGICAKNCPFEAITMDAENNLPVIDMLKCRDCRVCVEKCPQKSIKPRDARAKVAVVNPDECIGCGICTRVCKFEAVTGDKKSAHTVDAEKCRGCEACVEKCPKKAIKIQYK
jgi:electron transport complex protein RnfB